MDARQIAEEAFMLGFMISREGFNAECTFDHCADTELKPSNPTTEKNYRQYMEESPAFCELRAAMLRRLGLA